MIGRKLRWVLLLGVCFTFLLACNQDSGAMKLNKPVDFDRSDNGPPDNSNFMTLILLKDQIAWFRGTSNAKLNTEPYVRLREVVRNHLELKSPLCEGKVQNECWDPKIILKPAPNASYSQLTEAMDELIIAKARKYAVEDFEEADSMLLVKTGLNFRETTPNP